MADTKLADLTALTTPSGDDILYIVDDPAGTPLDRKIALDNLFTRGTITADAPVLNMSQTWNNAAVTFTSFKLNITDTASNAASLLMDLQVGGTSRVSIRKGGGIKCAPNGTAHLLLESEDLQHFNSAGVRDMLIGGNGLGVALPSIYQVTWGSTSTTPLTRDLFLTRRGAANLRLGAADAAAPVAQTLSVQSVVAGTTNTAGANLTITGSQGTGTGAGGSIIFQVAPAGSSGSAQNALSTILELKTNSTIKVYNNIELTGSNAGVYNATTNLTLGDGSDNYAVAISGAANAGVTLKSAGVLRWTNGTSFSGTADVLLYRDAANTLALRNGANAQTFRVYNTESSSLANFERLNIGWDGTGALISFTAGGTGNSGQAIRLNSNGAMFNVGASGGFVFGSTGANWWQINNSGHFLTSTDNTYDIGASGGSRPRNVYVAATVEAQRVIAGGDVGDGFGLVLSGRARIHSPAGGVMLLANISNSDFGRLQFGGTTSSFPAIKRSSTTLQARLADDTAFASVQGKLTTDTAYTATVIVPTGYLTLYDSTGTAYRVPCVV